MLVVKQPEHTVMYTELIVLSSPGESTPVFRIRFALKSGFVAIVDTRHTRKSIFQNREQLDFADCCSQIFISCHHRNYTFSVVAADKVQSSVKVLFRIIFSETHEFVSRLTG